MATKKPASKKTTAAPKAEKQTKMKKVTPKQALTQQQEIQEMIGSSTKDTREALKQLREQQKALRDQAKALRDQAKAEGTTNTAARKAMTNGRKNFRTDWVTLRNNIKAMRASLKTTTSIEEVTELKNKLMGSLQLVTNDVEQMFNAKLEMLGVTAAEPAELVDELGATASRVDELETETVGTDDDL